QHEDGLPQNAVQAVAQTSDGYLWAATQQGLARFNSAEFVVFDERSTPALKNRFTFVLAPARDGSLWIGTFNAGVARFRDGEFTFFSTKDGLAADAIRSIYETRDHTIWIGTTNGLSYYTPVEVPSHKFPSVSSANARTTCPSPTSSMRVLNSP